MIYFHLTDNLLKQILMNNILKYHTNFSTVIDKHYYTEHHTLSSVFGIFRYVIKLFVR